MAKKLAKRDILSQEELEAYNEPLLVPGRAYIWIQTFGWAVVGFYIRHEGNGLETRVAHANHFNNANKDYGELIREGGSAQTEWRYEGSGLIWRPNVLRVMEYFGEVPRGPIARS